MYEILKYSHSGLRWLVLIALIVAVFNAGFKMNTSVTFTAADKRINLLALIFTHLQFVLGLLLYFTSPLVQFGTGTMKNTVLRFYTVEHISLMLIAIALVTIGYSKAKRASQARKKFKQTFMFYLIGLILILAAIPWPFRNLGAGWF